MFFGFRCFFISTVLCFMTVLKVNAKPLFFEDYKLIDTEGKPVMLFSHKVQPLLRFDLLMETWEFVLPLPAVYTHGIQEKEKEERSVSINPNINLGEQHFFDDCSGDSIVVSYTTSGNIIFIKENANKKTHNVNFRSYASQSIRYLLSDKIMDGRYGKIGLVDEFLAASKKRLGSDYDKVMQVESSWRKFFKRYQANLITSNVQTFLKHTYIGLVSSYVIASRYPDLHKEHYSRLFGSCGGLSTSNETISPIREAQLLVNKAINKLMNDALADNGERVVKLFVAACISPFYKQDLYDHIDRCLEWDSLIQERQKLPHTLSNKKCIPENILEEYLIQLDGDMTIGSCEAKNKDEGREDKDTRYKKLQIEKADVLKSRFIVVAIKHLYAFDQKLKEECHKKVKDLHGWLADLEIKKFDNNESAIALIRQKSELTKAFVEPRALLLIELLAEKTFIENVLKPDLERNESFADLMKNPDRVNTFIDSFFIQTTAHKSQQSDSTVYADSIKQVDSDCIDHEEQEGEGKTYSMPLTPWEDEDMKEKVFEMREAFVSESAALDG